MKNTNYSVKKLQTYFILLTALLVSGTINAKVNNYIGLYADFGEWTLLPTESKYGPSFGLNGQSFAFNGYLPVDRSQRAAAIRRLEERALREHQTQLFIEAPYRNNQMLETLCATLKPHTMVCVACDLTLPTQYIRTLECAIWKKEREKTDLHKRNTVFLIGR